MPLRGSCRKNKRVKFETVVFKLVKNQDGRLKIRENQDGRFHSFLNQDGRSNLNKIKMVVTQNCIKSRWS